MSPSPNHLTSIAIVGASGTVGSHITSSLLQTPNLKITALTRPNSTATFPPNVKTAVVDYSDPDTIVSALRGKDALIISLSVSAPPSTQEMLIRAAAKANVKWILPNEFGMFNSEAAQRETVGHSKIKTRELIEELGMSWVGVSCGFWYEHSLSNPELFGIDVNKMEVVMFGDDGGDGEGRINVSTWGRVGEAVGSLVGLPIDGEDGGVTLNEYKNQMVFVASFAVSQRDMLDSVQRVTDTTDADWKIEKVDARKRYEEAKESVKRGDRSAFGRMLYTRYFYDDEGLFEKTHGLENEKLGLVSEGLDEATMRAIELVKGGYWNEYRKN